MAYIAIPKRAKDIARQRFARLVVLGAVAKAKDNSIKWLCQCDCGGTTITTYSMLRTGHTKSCGCWRDESRLTHNITHGKSNSKTYIVWRNMITRCTTPSNENYPYYGARGISICQEWIKDFQAFYDYVSQLERFGEKGMTLDRIDADGNYEPGNLRWATPKEQNRNVRRNRLITFNGKTQCSAAWAEETGLKRATIENRLNLGWSAEKALTTPVKSPNAAMYLKVEK